MKLIEFNIKGDNVKIERNFLGNERLYINDEPISEKRTLFGTHHNLKINNRDYTLKYKVKLFWNKWTGKPTFELLSEEKVISEYKINNTMFFTLQFIFSFMVFYIVAFIFWALIESAKRGFVFDAH